MKENLIIIHGGGPTAVLNCSLYGAVREAQASGLVEHVYGAVGGTGGLLKEKLLVFGSVPEEELERLPTTPATAIGTSRDALEAEDYARMADILAEKRIRYVLMNGGNGTMDACGKLAAVCRDRGISVMGIPKTMDNDIAVTDHCPGFGSVARYMAGTVRELGVDVRSLPIHVVVLEALGRNAGWTTAAAALAREQEGDAPHLLYPPERPFHEDEFLDRVGDRTASWAAWSWWPARVSTTTRASPSCPPSSRPGAPRTSEMCPPTSGAAGGAAAGHQGPQRSRASWPGPPSHGSPRWMPPKPRRRAARACRAVLAGETGQMVAFRRLSSAPYRCETLVPIEEVMLGERVLPAGTSPPAAPTTEAFCGWCRPLLGPELPSMARLL
ncbi:MAG: 6-phosphofructokinase [Flavonifractor plautii]